MGALKNIEGAQRRDIYRIPASEIVVNEADNVRAHAPSRDHLEGLKQSIAERGQLDPVIVFRQADGKLKLVAGYNRYKAITELNKDRSEEEQIPILCTVRTGNQEDAFLTSLDENLNRADLSPIDRAKAMKTLKDVYGWDDNRIGNKFRLKRASVWQYLTLLTLEKEYQNKIIDGTMKVTTGFDLARISDPAERKKVADESTDDEGKVNRQKVIKISRDMGAMRAAKGRTAKEMEDELQTWIGSPPDAVSIPAQYIAKSIIEFRRGRITSTTLLDRIEKVTVATMPKTINWRPRLDEEEE